VNQRWEAYYQFFPADAQVLEMAPTELGPFLLRYMLKQHSMTNRFNFGQVIPGGQVADCLMEAWTWLENEGFIARRAQDQFGNDFFVTRAGREVAASEDFEAHRKAGIFPDGLDAVIMRAVKPLFVRGDYDTAAFRAFKEVEVRVRRKDSSLAGEYGVDLMNKAFGPTGPLMKGQDKKERASMRDMFAGAFAIQQRQVLHRPNAQQSPEWQAAGEAVTMVAEDPRPHTPS